MHAPTLVLTSPVAGLVARLATRVPDDATIEDAAAAMTAEDISAVLVGDDAIISERDITRAVAAGVPLDTPALEVATAEPVRVRPGTTIVEALRLMFDTQLRHLVVELGHGQEGVVSLRVLSAALLQAVDPEPWLSAVRVMVTTPTEVWLG